MNLFFIKKYENILILFVGLSFFYGVLSYQHYAPSSHDFFINSISFILCSFGLLIFYIFNSSSKINLNSLLWVFLFIIFIFQPKINNIIYVDGLIFPLAQILIAFFLSIAISNIKNKFNFIKYLSLIIILTSFLLFLTQLIHFFNINFLVEVMHLPLQTRRFSGNLFQPNQTAFVLVLGVISTIFLLNNNKFFLKFLIVFLLSLGVAITASRTGFLMLLFSLLVFNLFNNFRENIKIIILKDFICGVLGLFFGFFLYSYFSESVNTFGRVSENLKDVRLNFLHQTFLIIKDNPITGVGWKNFASTTLQYYDQVGWMGLTDHSHFIFGHIISEFGILGWGLIILFFIIFVKNLSYIKDKSDIYVLLVLLTFIIYSSFEYPLWYFRYLMIFSIFFALYDKGSKKIYEINKNYLVVISILILLISAAYYSFQYKKLAYLNNFIFNDNVSDKVKYEQIIQTNFIFGFSYFNDLFLYQSLSIDGFMLKESIEVGERLVKYIPLNQYLVKQGTLLGLDGQTEEAYNYFKASCSYHQRRECENTKNYLRDLSLQYPEYFNSIYKRIDTNF
ncbi:O-antigen ligase [Acinetobacter sp. BY484]|uniref:O-antigen ligase family protein n=1 Tax=Acinetobacter sp. BY484 TaxID=2820674 RepID=UPI001C2494FC|nr:O-antigen ligase family protein [Acinetobacter sp. BY484]